MQKVQKGTALIKSLILQRKAVLHLQCDNTSLMKGWRCANTESLDAMQRGVLSKNR